MKTKILITVLILLIKSTAFGQWTALNSGTSLNLSVINKNQQGSLFIASKDFPGVPGIIIKSDNAGSTWYNVANNNGGFSDLVFPSANVGLAIPVNRDTIFKSSDGGNTWLKQYSLNCYGGGYGFPQVCFTDSVTGYAPGYKSTDEGNSWFLQDQFLNFFPDLPTAISFINDSTGMVAGWNDPGGQVWKTTDRGITWNWMHVPYYTYEIYSMYFATSQIGYCTSQYFYSSHKAEIIKTTDGGNTWNSIYKDSLYSPYYTSVFCTDSNTCYAVGAKGSIIKTTDGGITWQLQYSGTLQTLRKVLFTDANTGYIAGDSGTILKTANGGVGIHESYENKSIFKIYPNPLTSPSLLEFNLYINDAEIVIYDAVGKEMVKRKIASNSMEIEKGSLKGGIYFVKVNTEGKQYVQKIIIE